MGGSFGAPPSATPALDATDPTGSTEDDAARPALGDAAGDADEDAAAGAVGSHAVNASAIAAPSAALRAFNGASPRVRVVLEPPFFDDAGGARPAGPIGAGLEREHLKHA